MRRKNLENDESKIARASLSSKLTKHNGRRLEGDWRKEYTELSTGLLRYVTAKKSRNATPDLALVGLNSPSVTGTNNKWHKSVERRTTATG